MKPVRRIALAGMMAALGAGAWFVTDRGPEAIAAAAKTAEQQTVKAVIAKKRLSPVDQEALVERFKAQYPQASQKLVAWTPVTAAKLEALHEAYRALPASERKAIASEVSQWQRQVWQEHPGIRATWKTGGHERERKVAETALELSAAERRELDSSVTGLWKRMEAQHPRWAAQVDSILRQ